MICSTPLLRISTFQTLGFFFYEKARLLSLPFIQVYIKATGNKSAEMVTDEGAIYTTSNRGYNWRAAVQETVSATLNRYSLEVKCTVSYCWNEDESYMVKPMSSSWISIRSSSKRQ